ncbi:response regulator [Chitinispirillales bacterium ANBcel5]|uniref:response regulator transcription factor n=1 Tax=Cellulosispirillum alkaliphilum TaxID=3039283 RepID=UPI002A55A4FF|nr:response regulator [Chitinispirillales bacterium ANBcel5]
MNEKILVVEDESDIADLIKLVLESADFKVKTVLDPLKALETAREYRPDVIFLDLSMPKMDGWTVFKHIRNDSSFADVPVAILTAKTQHFDQMVGLHVMNADAYITKPFGKQELIDKTYELIKGKK